MTTIITRLYEDDAAANSVAAGLSEAGFPDKLFDVIGGGGDATEAMTAAKVSEKGMAAYGPQISQGKKLVVVRAPITPFGASKRAISIMDEQPSIDVGLPNEGEYIRGSIVPQQGAPFGGGVPRTSAVGKEFKWSLAPIPLIMHYPRQNSAYSGTRRFGALWPTLILKKKSSRSAFTGTKRFGAFLMPLLNKRKPLGKTVFQGEKRFGDFLLPLLIKRS